MLKQLRSEMTSLLDCFVTPAVLLEADHTILAANQAYRKRYGDGRPLQGRHCDQVLADSGLQCSAASNTCPLDDCQLLGTHQQAMHLHNSQAIQVDLYPIRDGSGVTRYFLELLTPHTEAGLGVPDSIVGQSPVMQQLQYLLHRAAPSDLPVLLLGESGTGKELAAAAIHRASPRSNGPFVVLDCSGLSETLFESELFGHEKGAFTGAQKRHIGLAEAANGGTLFLDEVGDIPLGLQIKLLRLLETGYFRRVGGIDPIRSQFRLVSATHRDLPRMVAEERFRQDLYFRIGGFPISLPPLRERREDIPLLAETLLRRIPQAGRLRLAPETLKALVAYDFPGNIRELRNILGRAVLLADESVILPEHLPPSVQAAVERVGSEPVVAGPAADRMDQDIISLEQMESRYLRWAREHHGGDRRDLAQRLGISERTLYRKLEALKIPD